MRILTSNNTTEIWKAEIDISENEIKFELCIKAVSYTLVQRNQMILMQ
jgi:hypothetical protein